MVGLTEHCYPSQTIMKIVCEHSHTNNKTNTEKSQDTTNITIIVGPNSLN
jgi:hypothetical protein